MPQDYDDDIRRDPHADEDLVPFDVQDYSSRRSMRLFIIVVLVAVAAVALLFKVYYKGFRDRSETPRIQADNKPFKVEPENPGGEKVPNQDKTVYDVMNGTAGAEDVINAEKPEDPVVVPKTVPIRIKDRTADETLPAADTTISAQPESQPVITAPKPAPVMKSAYVVQVASVRSQSAAETLWKDIQAKHSALIPAGAYKDIKRVNLETKGVYYRLRIAGLSGKDQANQLCKNLEARQQACFVTRQ